MPFAGGEILFLGHRIPFPPNRGDKIRSHHVLRRLARIAPVHVGCFADDDGDAGQEVELANLAASYCLLRRSKPLALAGVQAITTRQPISLTAFYDTRMAQYVAQALANSKVSTIFVFSGQMGQYVPVDFAGRVIMDFCDVDSVKFEAYAALKNGPMGWMHAREERLLRAEEERLALLADISLLISHKEAELFRSRLSPKAQSSARIEVLGNGIDAEFFDPTLVQPEPQIAGAGGPRLIFTGQMDYPPNIAAVERVARQILPLVRRRSPEATFHIVGRAPTDAVKALAGEGVFVWGSVEDVRVWLRGADMALCPLEIARGVQNKVLEAMAMELPVVLTSAAATGIHAMANHHFAVADSDAGLAAAIVELATNPRGAAQMGMDARRLVVEQQSWQSALAPLTDYLSAQPKARRDAA
jgi:sugar transferase (PEP-CTERM/EpsH1 system associated)